MTAEIPEQSRFTTQETILANAMLQKMAHSTIRYTLNDEGEKVFELGHLDDDQYGRLLDDFTRNEQESLSWARGALTAIHQDNRLSPDEKAERLDRYLDAYTSLTVKLDHEAHPPTGRHGVGEGVPSYIPDGFVDLGSQRTKASADRNREMVVVNKRAIFERYRDVLYDIFATDYSGMTGKEATNYRYDVLSRAVYEELPYDFDMKSYGGGRVDLADMEEGVCRHIALTFQVLAQAVGEKTRLAKGRARSAEGWTRHAVVLTENHGGWELNDVTYPVLEKRRGEEYWYPRVMPIDGPPRAEESRHYKSYSVYGGKPYEFITDENSWWLIEHV
jgi:hypothetical protein